MDTATLVDKDIDAGRDLLEALDSSGLLVVKACMWHLIPETHVWRLVVASPLVETEGPAAAYTAIQKVLKKSQLDRVLPLDRVSAISPRDNLIKSLQKGIGTGKGVSGIRLTNNIFNNMLIEDVYVYRLTK